LPCPSGKYPDLNGTCQNCSAQCSLCTSLQNCTQCKLPYFLLNGQCSQNCLSNQYSITVSISSTSAKFCKDCLSPCDRCTSNTSCTHCESGYFLTSNGSCVADCGDGYYGAITIVGNETYRNCTPCSDIQCKICTKDGCRECKNGSYLFGLIQPSLTNGSCVADCPSGYYKDSSMIPFSCKQCSIARCDKCNTTYCFACLPPYILLITNGTSSCVSACPDAMVPIITNGISKC
jgi:proprotein convertase subtilisin/kexin type 5